MKKFLRFLKDKSGATAIEYGLIAAFISLVIVAGATVASPGFALPSKTIKEMICGSIDVIIQTSRLRDGSRRITHVTEVMGMEGEVIITQDLFVYEIMGEDANGKIIGQHRSTGIARPHFWDRARYFGEDARLADALEKAETLNG